MKSFVRSCALAVVVALALVGAAAPSFAGITYNVTNYAAGQNNWTVNGTITASGVGTYTDVSAITAWDVTLSKPGAGSYQFTNALSGHDGILLSGTLKAEPDKLDLSNFTVFRFTELNGKTNLLAWYVGPGQVFDYSGKISGSVGFSSSTYSPSNNGVLTIGTATPSAVPEIDPATGSSALSLVAGVLAMVEQRRRRGLKAGLAG